MPGRTLRRKMWINLALTALVGALVVVVVIEPGHEPPAPPPVLTQLEPGSVSRVIIEQPGQSPVRLERSESGWHMTEPRDLRASSGKIDTLLEVAGAESHRQYAFTDIDAGELGLAEPKAVLTLDDTRLVFGGSDPIEGRRYVRVDDTVHLVGGRHLSRIRNEPIFWADNALLPPGVTITALELPDVTLTRDDKGLWHAEPEPQGVSADALVNLVDNWQHASALGVEEAPEEIPSDAGQVRVHIEEKPEPIVFDLVGIKTGFELIRRDLGLRYTLTGPQRAELLELKAPEPEPAEAEIPADEAPAP